MMRNSFWVIERSLQEQRIFLPNDARQDFSLFLGKTSFSRNRILSLRSGGKTELLASRTVRRSSDEKKTNTLKIGGTPVSTHETLLSGEDSKWRKICRFAKTFINKKRRNLENKKLSRKTKTKPENVFLMIIINKDGRWTKDDRFLFSSKCVTSTAARSRTKLQVCSLQFLLCSSDKIRKPKRI